MARSPHPALYAALYYPFGALGGYITVAMTFMGTRSGLSITEGAFFVGVSMCVSYLKWIWAPIVDVTLTPKAWYYLATSLSALSMLAMAAVPIGPDTLWLLMGIVALGTLVNSAVGMAVESIMAFAAPPEQRASVSGWFQVGNLGGAGLGGGLGLLMLEHFPAPWMAGAVLGATFLLSGLALRALPDVPPHRPDGGLPAAFRDVAREIGEMGRSKAGLLTAVLFFLPLGTGAASAVLTQATVAAQWGAGAGTVSLMQGWISGIATSIGCLAAGRLQDPWGPRGTYAVYSVALGVSSVAMAISPFTPPMYVVWSVVYNLVLGLCYASFTSATLHAMGKGSAATKYNLYASLANFPIWWVGLLLAWVADHHGSAAMLHAEAALAAVGTTLFVLATRVVSRSRLPETVAAT